MDTTVQDDPLVGQLLDGRYRIEGRLAAGGMATVYRAVDTRLDRVLALKVMHPGLAADTGFVERFIREAKAAARLAHPNVAAVFDQGTDRGYVYLAMEYVPGGTLRDLLRERGALSPRDALDIMEPVLAGLGAAHRAGLVHRDVKPENVLIGDAPATHPDANPAAHPDSHAHANPVSHLTAHPDGHTAARVKVVDFGLVRTVDAQTSATTGTLLGTVSYLAPEQIGNGTVDQRADVYACGLLLYELLTGGKPYDGDTPVRVVFQHLNEDVPPPSAVLPGLAPQLDGLVARAAARDPRDRPQDAVRMLAELRQARATLTAEQLDARPAPVHPAARATGSLTGPGDATRVVPRPEAESAAGENPASENVTSVLPRPGPEDATSIVPLPVPTAAHAHVPPHPHVPAPDEALHRTARLLMPAATSTVDEARHDAAHGSRRGRRGLVAVLVALAVVLGVGAGVWYAADGRFTKVPGVLALPQAQAERKLSQAGLSTKVRQDYSLTVPSGSVIAVDPGPGRRVHSHGTVTLTVSRGPQVMRVPSVKGLTLNDARQAISAAHLTPGTVTKAFSDDVPSGAVLSTDPAIGADRSPGTPVSLVVSRGKAVEVPDVIGDSVPDAQEELEEDGFKVVLAPDAVYSDEADKDTVALESPGHDTLAGEGETVTITVSKGEQTFGVPDVTGRSEGDAKQALHDAGFTHVRVITLFFGDTVFSQSPDGGSQSTKDTTVTLWVR